MQIELFEAVEGTALKQLPEEVREAVIELLARSVLECVGQIAGEGEADDDR